MKSKYPVIDMARTEQNIKRIMQLKEADNEYDTELDILEGEALCEPVTELHQRYQKEEQGGV